MTDAEWQMLLLRRIDPESFRKGIEQRSTAMSR